jgi:hypothetical protein
MWSVAGGGRSGVQTNNLPQLHSHTSGVLHGGVSELMASCVCRFLRLVALSFLDGIVEAEEAIPSSVSILLLCSRYYGVGPTSWWSREDVLRMWQMKDGVSYVGFVDRGRQFWFPSGHRSRGGCQSSIAWPRICCLGLILSTVIVLSLANYFRGPKSCWSAWSRIELGWCVPSL